MGVIGEPQDVNAELVDEAFYEPVKNNLQFYKKSFRCSYSLGAGHVCRFGITKNSTARAISNGKRGFFVQTDCRPNSSAIL
jgi:hypothetical protein